MVILDAQQEDVLHLGDVGLPLDELIGRSWAVLGITGSGKSNSIAVMVEDLIAYVPFVILDADGEYYALKERFNFLIAGGEHSEIDVTVGNADILAQAAYDRGQSIILDVSQISIPAAADLLHAYLSALWEVATVQRKPLFVVIEEASQFAPQGDRSALQDLLTQYAIRGRKRGIGLIVGNQRSSTVGKNIITQARYGLYHRVVHPTDMRVLKDLIPWDGKRVEAAVRALHEGQAVFVHGDQVDIVSVRLRHTFHGGATPGVDTQTPTLQAADPSFLADLRELLAVPAPDGDVDALHKKIADLEAIIEKMPTLGTAGTVIHKHEMTINEREAEIRALRAELDRYKTTVGDITALMKADGRADMPLVDYVRWLHTRLSEHVELRQKREDLIAGLRSKIAKAIKLDVPAAAVAPGPMVQTSLAQPAPKPGSALAGLVAERQETAQKRQEQVRATGIKRQEQKLAADAQTIGRQEKRARSMLAYLIENPSQWVDADYVGRLFAYEVRDFRRVVSRSLLHEGLMRRLITRQDRDHVYRLANDLAQQYPDLDISVVRASLLAACGVGS